MSFLCKVIQLILCSGVLQTNRADTTGQLAAHNESIAKSPIPQHEDKSAIQQNEERGWMQNNSLAEDKDKEKEFCVLMKPLSGDEIQTERQSAALACLFFHGMQASGDASALFNCLSQQGR